METIEQESHILSIMGFFPINFSIAAISKSFLHNSNIVGTPCIYPDSC